MLQICYKIKKKKKKDLESIIKFTQLAYLPYMFSYQGRAKTEAGDSYTLLKQGY